MSDRRVALISYHTCPLASEEGKETGGMNVYVLELGKKLAQRGWRVDAYTRSQDKSEKIVTVVPGFRVIHINAGPQATLPKKELYQFIPEFVENFLRFTRENDLLYEALDCHYYLSGLIGLEIQQRQRRKLPLIMTFHTLALMKNLVARDELEKESRERIDAELTLVRQAQAIVAPSRNEQQYLEYLYEADPAKIHIIHPGVDLSLFRPIPQAQAKQVVQADPDAQIVLFVGRIEPLKGIDGLLYAMKILTGKNPDLKVRLWIVGGDVSQPVENWSKELQKLEQLRQILKIDPLVKFVGQRPQRELPYYYNAAELVVMPSHYESFSMTAAEAMACGVPVITTNVAGVSTLMDDQRDALITSVSNPLGLAQKIEQLLLQPDVRRDLRSALRDNVKNLTWDAAADGAIDIYQQLTVLQSCV
ncbi:MAG TPA: glycosyltransferase [Phototrophicaceae bacterium]|nr:glycosyltransferase [Phototrophicaceae bacterium]